MKWGSGSVISGGIGGGGREEGRYGDGVGEGEE